MFMDDAQAPSVEAGEGAVCGAAGWGLDIQADIEAPGVAAKLDDAVGIVHGGFPEDRCLKCNLPAEADERDFDLTGG